VIATSGFGPGDLLFSEFHELDRVGRLLVNSKPLPEELLDVLVVIQCACLVSAAEMGIKKGSRHLMLYLMPETDQEARVVRRVAIQGRPAGVDAPFEFPMLVRSVPGAIEDAAFGTLPVVAILDLLASVIGVKQVSPSDHHQDDKRLRLETDLGVVENPNGRKCSLPGFDD
jgi:hypothetical protein